MSALLLNDLQRRQSNSFWVGNKRNPTASKSVALASLVIFCKGRDTRTRWESVYEDQRYVLVQLELALSLID